MKNYEEVLSDNDIVTVYFIMYEDNRKQNKLHAYTTDKELLKAYLDFHNCNKFTVHEVTDKVKRLRAMLSEAVHLEIEINNIYTRNPNHHSKHILKELAVPMTQKEFEEFAPNVEYVSLGDDNIPYDEMALFVPLLKDKYQAALHGLLLNDVINKVEHNVGAKGSFVTDDLLIFYHTLSHLFN